MFCADRMRHCGEVRQRTVIGTSTTPDGQRLVLSKEGDDFVMRVGGLTLMSSRMHGSEEAMATLASEALGAKTAARVLVGGLGMGYTLRAALDAFPAAQITVAELLPIVVEYNRGVLADLAGNPLGDPRTAVFTGDVRTPLAQAGWDVVLLDVDNGPDPFTTASNASLYSKRGVALLAAALTPDGVCVVWSAAQSPAFVKRTEAAGLTCRQERVHARGKTKKGSRHTLFVLNKPPC